MTSLPPSQDELATTGHAIKPRNLALGIERIGFFALSYRTLCALLFVALCALAAVGFATRVQVDDSLSQLFRSDTDEYRTYQEVTRRFPSNEFDVLLVIEGDGLLERSSLEKLRELAIDIQLHNGTRGLISMFSAREPATNGQIPPPLFPTPLPQGADYQKLIERVASNEIIRGKMLSDDRKLTLMVLALDPAAMASERLPAIIDAIRKDVNNYLAGTGLKGDLSGVPVMQLEIRNAIERDRLTYNALGFAVGCLIAIMFFRRLSFMIIAAAAPLAAILLSLGALGRPQESRPQPAIQTNLGHADPARHDAQQPQPMGRANLQFGGREHLFRQYQLAEPEHAQGAGLFPRLFVRRRELEPRRDPARADTPSSGAQSAATAEESQHNR